MSDTKKPAQDKTESGKSSFWTSIPNNIKALTGLIAAISGLLIALNKAGIIGQEKVPVTPPAETNTTVTAPPCYKFETKSFEYIPYSLYYSLKDSKKVWEFMYWFHIKGKNDCDYPLNIKIAFESLRDEPAVEPERKSPLTYTLVPGQQFNVKLHPGFRFLPQDIDDTLEVKWGVSRSDTQAPLSQGKADIQVLSKRKFLWNLPKPGGAGNVDEQFLLATLTAWTKPNDARVKARSKALLNSIEATTGLMEFADNLLEACYNQYFTDSEQKITLIQSHAAFPPAGGRSAERIIRPPAIVLESRESDQLEAAILMSALTAKKLLDRGVRVVLIFTDANPSSILLAWLDGANWNDPEQWRAISMDTLATQSFAENTRLTSAQIREVLKSEQSMAYELMADDQDGIYYTGPRNTIAIDLNRAGKFYGIKSLP